MGKEGRWSHPKCRSKTNRYSTDRFGTKIARTGTRCTVRDRKSESIKKFANTEDTEARECIPSRMSRKKKSMRQMEMTETLPQGIFRKKDRYYYFFVF